MRKIVLLFYFTVNLAFAKEYFVSTSGNDSNDGLSENNSWRTISHAAKIAIAGDVVWIKAGNYGSENVVFRNDGSSQNPISFIGYKNRPGDIQSLYFDYESNSNLEPTEMPLLDGKNRASGIGLKLYSRKYILIENVQVTNYRYCIDALSGANNLTLNRVIASNSGGTANFPPVSGGNCIRMDSKDNHSNTVRNSVVMNATMVAMTLGGNNNLIENNYTYADQDDINGDKRSMDYHVLISGSDNIIRNHYAEHVGDLKHTGHGIVLKTLAGTVAVENNLIENCDIVNINGSVEFRHRKVKNNIARDIRIVGKTSRYSGGFHFRDGASYNTVENSVVKNLKGLNGGISFYDTVEDGGTQWSGNNNIVRNTVFENCELGIRVGSYGSTEAKASGNRIVNCIFTGSGSVIGFFPSSVENTDNLIQNSIIIDSNKLYHKDLDLGGWIHSYNNYFSNRFEMPSGNGNKSYSPEFLNQEKGDYRLKSTSKLIDSGFKSEDVKKDFEGNSRPQGESHDIGVFEFTQNTTGFIEADAGEDRMICLGSEITLTASGGTEYLWSNGARTRSITVRPDKTTTYSVTVREGENQDKDEVKVTVVSVDANLGVDVEIESGETVQLTAPEGDEYMWSTGETSRTISISPTESSTVWVEVSIATCKAKDEINIIVKSEETELEELIADAGQDETICYGDSAILTVDGGNKVLWSNGSTNRTITVKPEFTTTYSVQVFDETGGSDTDSITVFVNDCHSGLDNFNSFEYEVRVYPNPTEGIINLDVNIDKSFQLFLISMNGSIMMEDSIENTSQRFTKTIDISNFDKGVYFFRMIREEEQIVRKVILI